MKIGLMKINDDIKRIPRLIFEAARVSKLYCMPFSLVTANVELEVP